METRIVIGWNLRRLRVVRGLSQERLALEAGIDRSYVGRVERGEENVTVTVLDALAAAIGVEVAALFQPIAAGQDRPAPLPSGRKPKRS